MSSTSTTNVSTPSTGKRGRSRTGNRSSDDATGGRDPAKKRSQGRNGTGGDTAGGNDDGGLQTLFSTLLDEAVATEATALKFLRTLEDRAASSELADAIGCALADTEHHHRELTSLQQELQQGSRTNKRGGGRQRAGVVAGIVAAAKPALRKVGRSPAGDVLLTTVLQKIEHHGIAVVGSLAAWAEALRDRRAHSVTAEALRDKKLADRYLTEIGESIVHQDLAGRDASDRSDGQRQSADRLRRARAGARD